MAETEYYNVISETFELTFFDRAGGIDSIQQFWTEEDARNALSLFDEPESADLYSAITLTKTEWYVNARHIFLDALVFD